MKFGKRLRSLIEETLPEWRDKFLCYKVLKKHLKSVSSAAEREEAEDCSQLPNKRRRIDQQEAFECGDGKRDDSSNNGRKQFDYSDLSDDRITADKVDFLEFLNAELEKFNAFFVEKEEEYIIRHKELQERIETVQNRSGWNGVFCCENDYNREMIKVITDIVNFHGEMVLLENYSALNYTGVVKIVKKYDKRTGGQLRLALIKKVLEQPFFTTDLLFSLVTDCEKTLQLLFPFEQTSDAKIALSVTFNLNCKGDNILYRSTVAAIRAMREMRKESSTQSVFSLPPLDNL